MAIIWTRFVGGVLASIVIASQVVHAIRGMADTISGVTYEEAQSSLSRTGSCCGALSDFLGDQVSYPGEFAYGKQLSSYYTQQESEVHPACIVLPTKTDDVALAVFVLNAGNKSLPGKCNFAVRSGGHTPWAGAANIASGVTIDLKNLNQIKVSLDNTTVEIGPGSRWGDVYKTLEKYGLATAGGRVSPVGVGGLLTGGGFSFFAPRTGFGCDTVVNFEVVLASGEVVNANSAENPDLMRALRGGSNNFGIVTAFTMRAFEQTEYWGGIITRDTTRIDRLFKGFEQITGSPDYDPHAAMIFNIVWLPIIDSWIVIMITTYTKAEVNPPFLRKMTSGPSLFNTMRIAKTSDFSEEIPRFYGSRQLQITGTYQNSASFMRVLYETTQDLVQPIRWVNGLQFALSFQPLPSIVFSRAAAAGGNVLGFDENDGDLFMLLVDFTWIDEADDQLVNSQAKLIFQEIDAKAQQLGLKHPYIYLNYAAPWQDPIDGYGAENREFLQNVSWKYDHEGLFQKNVPGGFKVFRTANVTA